MGPPHAKPFCLRECLREALEAGHLGTKIEVAVDLPETLPAAMADSDQIRIVFRNLISNARDAMPSGGRLAISGRLLDDQLEVAVQDNGVGIPKENLGRILEPLYSTKAKGLGLGLSLVRAILEKNQGTLGVTSQLGHGSTFTVRLRAAP
jgi:two-component system sensor kinase FixL